jgi:tetratricopeptide (TPR) repeat protein
LALNDFDNALNISPNDPYVLAQKGRLLLTYMDAHELAIDNLTKAISFSSRIDEGNREKVLSNIHRELADAYFIYGRTLYEQGQSAEMLQKALNEYSSVIELDSVNSLSHGQRGFIRWTYFSDDSNDEDSVKESLKDVTKAIDYLEQDITAVEWPGNEVPENKIVQMRRWFALRALIHQGLGNDEEYEQDISVVQQLNEMIP